MADDSINRAPAPPMPNLAQQKWVALPSDAKSKSKSNTKSSDKKPWNNVATQKPQQKKKKSSWRWLVFKLVLAYSAFLLLFQCPVGSELTSDSPAFCRSLHLRINDFKPHWDQHVAPQLEHPAAKQLFDIYSNYVHPPSQKAYAVAAKTYNTKVQPHVEQHINYAYNFLDSRTKQYREPLIPHAQKLSSQAQDYYQRVHSVTGPYLATAQSHYNNHVLPFGAKHGQIAWTLLQQKFHKYIWLNALEIYANVFQPQMDKIMDRLHFHSERVAEGETETAVKGTYGGEIVDVETEFEAAETQTATVLATATDESAAEAPEVTLTPEVAEVATEAETPEAAAIETAVETASETPEAATESATESASNETASATESSTEAPTSTETAPEEDETVYITSTIIEHITQETTHYPSASASASAPKQSDWSSKVSRMVDSAIASFQSDLDVKFAKLTQEARPGFMKTLRKLTSEGEKYAGELIVLVSDIENKTEESAETAAEEFDTDSILKEFQVRNEKIYAMTNDIRGQAKALAESALEIIKKERENTVTAVEDFFDVILLEAGRETANARGDDAAEWAAWKAYSQLKDQLQVQRERIFAYEVKMDVVNTALDESQRAAQLLSEEYSKHIQGLRGKTQFLIQQFLVLKQKKLEEQGKLEDEVVDAEFFEVSEDDFAGKPGVIGMVPKVQVEAAAEAADPEPEAEPEVAAEPAAEPEPAAEAAEPVPEAEASPEASPEAEIDANIVAAAAAAVEAFEAAAEPAEQI